MIKRLRIFIVVGLISVLIWYIWKSGLAQEEQLVYSGWLEGDVYKITAETSAKVDKIFVTEGQQVDRNAMLVQLDDQAGRIALAQAQANYAAAQARTGDVKAGSRPQQIAQAKAQVKSLSAVLVGAEENQKRAQQQLQRVKILFQEGGATPEQLETATNAEATARSAVNSAKSQVQSAQEQVKLLEAGATNYSISASSSQAEAAKQQVSLAELQVAKAKLLAPAKSRVEQLVLKLGELATPGTTIMTLIDDSNLFVTVYIPQSQLTKVKVGQKVKIYAENSSQETEGKITYIATQGEFTPKNIQTQEQRATQVFAVKVVLNAQKEASFKPGQAVEVYLD